VADTVYAKALAGMTPDRQRQLTEALAFVIFNLARITSGGQKQPF
jgi:hypothetical protein